MKPTTFVDWLANNLRMVLFIVAAASIITSVFVIGVDFAEREKLWHTPLAEVEYGDFALFGITLAFVHAIISKK